MDLKDIKSKDLIELYNEIDSFVKFLEKEYKSSVVAMNSEEN